MPNGLLFNLKTEKMGSLVNIEYNDIKQQEVHVLKKSNLNFIAQVKRNICFGAKE